MPLAATDLTFAYDAARPVVQSVSLTLNPGTITAVIGPNGAGKSTLFRLMLGLLTPTRGEVTLDSTPLLSLTHARRASRLIFIPQRASIAFAFTVREYVHMGLGPARAADARASIHRALERIDLLSRADDPVITLSVGQQQRAVLARALVQTEHAAAPAYILADEPTSAMDPRHAILTSNLLADLSRAGHAVALVAHDLTLASRLASHALVLDAMGRVAAFGPSPDTLTPAILEPVFDVRFTREPTLVPSPS